MVDLQESTVLVGTARDPTVITHHEIVEGDGRVHDRGCPELCISLRCVLSAELPAAACCPGAHCHSGSGGE
jgi:hypothetical protein